METRSFVGMRSILTIGLVHLALMLALAMPVAAQEGFALAIDPIGSFHRDGTATISGSVTCGGVDGIGSIDVVLRQQVGRVSTVTGSGLIIDLVCTAGDTIDWTVEISPTNGRFRGGMASASGRALFDGPDGTQFRAETTADVRLRR